MIFNMHIPNISCSLILNTNNVIGILTCVEQDKGNFECEPIEF
jgi:hypothetical protein